MNETVLYWDNDNSCYTLNKEEGAAVSRYAEVTCGEDGFIVETWYTEPDGLAVRIMFSEEHYRDEQYRETTRKSLERRNSCSLSYLQGMKLPSILYDEKVNNLKNI